MKYKIGIVEDDIKIAELLKAHLKKYGFEIWICNDFTNVAEHVLKHHLQLLLSWVFLSFAELSVS